MAAELWLLLHLYFKVQEREMDLPLLLAGRSLATVYLRHSSVSLLLQEGAPF
jgi:hypothetical protein